MLDQQVALVTGASRGIGAAIAQTLGKQGATVIGTATSESGAAAITAALAAAGVKGVGMALDVTQPEQVDAVLKQIAEQFGEISILVNNAGITKDTLLMRMKDEDWDAVLNTNLKSVFRMSQAVLRPMMKARQGRIINISSVVGHMGNAGQTNYAAAKAGMTGFTKSMAMEVGSRGITVNCVAPGFIETDMTAELPEEIKAKMLERVAIGRLGHVDEIAATVAFLASPAAAYITGETIHVNGGMYCA